MSGFTLLGKVGRSTFDAHWSGTSRGSDKGVTLCKLEHWFNKTCRGLQGVFPVQHRRVECLGPLYVYFGAQKSVDKELRRPCAVCAVLLKNLAIA